jgi:hypothetical protein
MSEGKIKFSCDCGKAYKVQEEFAGKKVRCKQCGESIVVPSASESVSSARAEAVSQRSVLQSKRLSPASGDGEARVSSRLAPAAAKPPERRHSGDTQVVEVVDLTPERKKYERKRDDESIKKGEGKLVQFEAGKAVKSYRLDREDRTLGRSSSCGIQVKEPSISKEHVRFEYKMGMFIATDLGSANGLVVNGKKLRRTSLKDTDVLQLGSVVFRLDCGK